MRDAILKRTLMLISVCFKFGFFPDRKNTKKRHAEPLNRYPGG